MSKTSAQLIRVGHSPDPDDAFMFYALAKDKIDMRGFKVEHVIEDIETLNQRALSTLSTSEVERHATSEVSPLEVTAVSCHAYAYLADRYAVMRSGASVGNNYGPILVQSTLGRDRVYDKTETRSLRGKRIAIPGKLTTAYLILQLYEKGFKPVFTPFDQIFDAVKSGKADLGLVIHEGQITHGQHGFEKILDLGEWWHQKTKLPLPLGIDIIRRDLGKNIMKSFAVLFKESIEYALNHRKDALEYASQFGRGISEDLNDRFVGMYVNDRTIDIGKDGEAGFRRLLDEAYQAGIIPKKIKLEFI